MINWIIFTTGILRSNYHSSTTFPFESNRGLGINIARKSIPITAFVRSLMQTHNFWRRLFHACLLSLINDRHRHQLCHLLTQRAEQQPQTPSSGLRSLLHFGQHQTSKTWHCIQKSNVNDTRVKINIEKTSNTHESSATIKSMNPSFPLSINWIPNQNTTANVPNTASWDTPKARPLKPACLLLNLTSGSSEPEYFFETSSCNPYYMYEKQMKKSESQFPYW